MNNQKNKSLTSEGEIVQLLKLALIEPNMIMNRTTRRLTPVKMLFMREDSLTPMANIALKSQIEFSWFLFCLLIIY